MAEVGRPSDYTPELLAAAQNYVAGGYEDAGDAVPTIAGLACELGISRETCYAWESEEGKEEFSDVLTRVRQLQERKLVNSGLRGDFNPAITKMMLTKHGYSDKLEQTHSGPDGKPIQTDNTWHIHPVTAKPNAANTTAGQAATADPDPQAD